MINVHVSFFIWNFHLESVNTIFVPLASLSLVISLALIYIFRITDPKNDRSNTFAFMMPYLSPSAGGLPHMSEYGPALGFFLFNVFLLLGDLALLFCKAHEDNFDCNGHY